VRNTAVNIARGTGKMKKHHYVLLFLAVFAIPFFLAISAWQANKCGEIKNHIEEIEISQRSMVEENKTIVAEISNLLAVDRLETEAQDRLGLRKIHPEGVTLIIMGRGRGY
jgi:hypothetical protein